MPISVSAEIGRRKMVGDTGQAMVHVFEDSWHIPASEHIVAMCAHNDVLYVGTHPGKIYTYRIK